MELIYLWVNEYKNITKQGFALSSKYIPKMQPDHTTIIFEKNENHIEDFFGNNINVMAIIGKNGAGKSSIVKIIFKLLFFQHQKNCLIDHEDYLKEVTEALKNPDFQLSSGTKPRRKEMLQQDQKKAYSEIEKIRKTLLNYNNPSEDAVLILKDGDEWYKVSFQDSYSPMMHNNEPIKFRILNKIDFLTIHFNYMLDSFYTGPEDEWVKSIYSEADSYQIPFLLEPYKNNDNKKIINLDSIEYLNNQHTLQLFGQLMKNEKITRFFNPTEIRLNINKQKIVSKVLDSRDIPKENKTQLLNEINELFQNKDYQSINNVYLFFKLLDKERYFFSIYHIRNFFRNVLENDVSVQSINQFLDEETHDSKDAESFIGQFFQGRKKIPRYELKKLLDASNFHFNILNHKNHGRLTKFNHLIGTTTNIHIEEEIINSLPPWVEVEYFEGTKSFKSLSGGEKTFFTFIVNLTYQALNIRDARFKSLNIFLDETELGLHPVWQREYLHNILTALRDIINKPINITLLSHSPFIISDLPKDNVVFLDTYAEDEDIVKQFPDLKGKCKNVSETISFQTFGSNIHELLSEAFFMNDGLSGEFARDKIEDLIRYLNGNPKNSINTNAQAQQIINMIGETVVQSQLQNMLDKKTEEIEKIHENIAYWTMKLKEAT